MGIPDRKVTMSHRGASRRLSLSAKGLERIESSDHEKDFTFVVGDDEYGCPSLIAEFLSPRVHFLRSQDITIHELRIETDDPKHLFECFLVAGFGHEIEVKAEDVGFFRSVCRELCNFEFFGNVVEGCEEDLGKAELLSRLEFMSGVSKITSECYCIALLRIFGFRLRTHQCIGFGGDFCR
jgi:hypothetical protein